MIWLLAGVGLVLVIVVPYFVVKSAVLPAGPTPPGRARAREHWLEVVRGPGAGAAYHVGGRTVSIGRAASSDVQIDDVGIARRHCEVVVEDGGRLRVRAVGGQTVRVEGAAVEEAGLQEGDRLEVGGAQFAFRRRWTGPDAGLRPKTSTLRSIQPTQAHEDVRAHVRAALEGDRPASPPSADPTRSEGPGEKDVDPDRSR